MAKTKVTFTLDEATVVRLQRTAERLNKPKSQVVREALQDYAERVGRLSERERLRMLTVFDEVITSIPQRSLAEVEKELRELRQARRQTGRGRDSGLPR